MSKKLLLGSVAAVLVIAGGLWLVPQFNKEGSAVTSQEAALAAEEPAAEASGDVAAVVNGTTISRKEVLGVIDTLPFKAQVAPEKLYPMIVDQMINQKLIESEVKKSALETDPEVQKKMDEVREQIVRSIFMEREIGKLVTDEQVQAAYEKFKKENEGKQELHARHILVKSEDEAKAVIKKLESGEDFKTLAKEKSTDPAAADGGDLGYFTKDAMVPEFANAAFDMKPGTYSKTPVKTQFGWHVIMVEDKRAKEVPGFDQVKPSLQNTLGQQALENFVKGLRQAAKIERFGMDGKPLN